MRLVIISGRSGSGKSTALDILEDNNFYCIDNLPASLLPALTESTLLQSDTRRTKIAVSVDARNQPHQLERFPAILDALKKQHIQVDLVFLDADDAILLKRFSETRRRHPLTGEQYSLPEALALESHMLRELREHADLTIDTSHLNLYQLGDLIRQRLLERPESTVSFLFKSFGFKRGIPIEADFVFDLRHLPNPYWLPELRGHSGLEQPVIDYLSTQDEVNAQLNDLKDYLGKWLPRIASSNRAYVTVAIGCTGGRHRSVYMTERLARALKAQLGTIQVRHRDVEASQ